MNHIKGNEGFIVVSHNTHRTPEIDDNNIVFFYGVIQVFPSKQILFFISGIPTGENPACECCLKQDYISIRLTRYFVHYPVPMVCQK
jgi:hypothetical protein